MAYSLIKKFICYLTSINNWNNIRHDVKAITHHPIISC